MHACTDRPSCHVPIAAATHRRHPFGESKLLQLQRRFDRTAARVVCTDVPGSCSGGRGGQRRSFPSPSQACSLHGPDGSRTARSRCRDRLLGRSIWSQLQRAGKQVVETRHPTLPSLQVSRRCSVHDISVTVLLLVVVVLLLLLLLLLWLLGPCGRHGGTGSSTPPRSMEPPLW